MSRLNVKEQFGKKIQSLFDSRPTDDTGIINRGFAIEKTIGLDSILFIGMNPSFNEEADKKNNTLGIVSYYDNFSYKFFSPMVKIAAACGVGFAHHDLYFTKETSQKEVIKLSIKHYNYFKQQIELTNEIINEARPIAIVIANAAVSELFVNKQTGSIHFDNELGTYILNTSGLNSIPVFCSGMLSETRALDIYSRERLVWQIQKTLNLPINDTILNNKTDWKELMY